MCEQGKAAGQCMKKLVDQHKLYRLNVRPNNRMIWLQNESNMASTNTDLHTAVRNGDVAALQAAIAAGAEINTKDQHKRTPLVLAAWAGQIVSRTALSSTENVNANFAMVISSEQFLLLVYAGSFEAAPGTWGICHRGCCR
jgi:hypothetical protein